MFLQSRGRSKLGEGACRTFSLDSESNANGMTEEITILLFHSFHDKNGNTTGPTPTRVYFTYHYVFSFHYTFLYVGAEVSSSYVIKQVTNRDVVGNQRSDDCDVYR